MKPPGARPGEFHPGDSPQIRAFPLENFQKKVVNLSKNPVNLSIFTGFSSFQGFFIGHKIPLSC